MSWGGKSAVISLLTVGLIGCATSGLDEFRAMQLKAAKMTENGAIAAAETGTATTQDLAFNKAQVRARAELARIIEVRVNSLQKDFREEVGDEKAPEYNAMFSEATKVLVARELRGSMAKDIRYKKTEEGNIQAIVLMVVDPKVVAEYFKQEGNTYARFRASQAFKELDDEVRKYEEFKRMDREL